MSNTVPVPSWLSKPASQTFLLILISMLLLFNNSLPLGLQRSCYTFSLLIKDLLLLFMPFVMVIFVAQAITHFGKKAVAFIITLLVFEFLSNLTSVWYAYICAKTTINYLPNVKIDVLSTSFSPLWRLPTFKLWLTADRGCIIGALLGCISVILDNKILHLFLAKSKSILEAILIKIFPRILPLFILGFILEIYHKNILHLLIFNYSILISYLCIVLLIYISLIFILSCNLNIITALRNCKNLWPAYSLALTSGSSLATLPWTIKGTEKNLSNPELAKVILPATVNIQQIGDCIVNAYLCFVIYRHFYGVNPSVLLWLQFCIPFVLARFATAAVLGGAIFIMLPIYVETLNFSPEMLTIILSLNILLDPLVTSSNVIANGALCKVFEKVLKLFKI